MTYMYLKLWLHQLFCACTCRITSMWGKSCSKVMRLQKNHQKITANWIIHDQLLSYHVTCATAVTHHGQCKQKHNYPIPGLTKGSIPSMIVYYSVVHSKSFIQGSIYHSSSFKFSKWAAASNSNSFVCLFLFVKKTMFDKDLTLSGLL